MILSALEKKLIENGLSAFDTRTINDLIYNIANKEGEVYSRITDEYILNHHKKLKVDIFSEKCNELIVNGFTASSGHKYRLNQDDQLNLMATKIELMEDDTILNVSWKTEDAGYVDHTREEWLAFYDEASQHKKAALYQYNTLKHTVLAATDHETIVATIWQDAPPSEPTA